MPALYVRRISDRLYKQARKIAESEGLSLSDFVIDALRQAIHNRTARHKHLKALEDIKRRLQPLPPGAPDSVEMIRVLRNNPRARP